MNPVERVLRRVDRFQQEHEPFSFLIAVLKKFGDDNAGSLVANLTHAGFVTLFPLLLITVTILGLLVGGEPGLVHSLQKSVLAQFPVIGPELLHNIHALHSSTALSLAIGLLVLLWGCLGLSQAGIFAMEQIWNLPGPERANYVTRLGRSVAFLAVLGIGVLGATILSGIGTFGGHAVWVRVLVVALSAVVNVGQFVLAFRVLTPKAVLTRRLLPGGLTGGLLWTAVQSAAGYLVGHNLRHESNVYGMFAIVLGLLAYIYLGARVALYSAEMNVVLHDHLWPRAIINPPLTAADQESMARQALQNRRRPEQLVQVSFTEPPVDRARPSPKADHAG